MNTNTTTPRKAAPRRASDIQLLQRIKFANTMALKSVLADCIRSGFINQYQFTVRLNSTANFRSYMPEALFTITNQQVSIGPGLPPGAVAYLMSRKKGSKTTHFNGRLCYHPRQHIV